MSRRGRPPQDCCGDCGASDPSWASINRGVLLCVECCSVHRSMGRHVSHVKSLHQGTWPPTLLSTINAMTVQNVNSIWEHSLHDPTASKHTRKKPQPKDSLQAKSEFIKAKHQLLAYLFRPRKDDAPCTPIELSGQLHSSVRSANLDTSLRLLVQGADPNYFNQEKGTSCLHVACRTGNSSQAELLIAWGADPNVKDISGNTPSALARMGAHNELADRMLELQYEVYDRLSYHLCNKKPNHKNGQHFLSFDKKSSYEMTDVAKATRGKLQLLPNHLFEELVMDVYDEIDRRECEAVWVTSASGLERYGVAFLPVNPMLSAPRNQGRQKLARLSQIEMAALIRDILMDAVRRQQLASLNPTSLAPNFNKINRNPSPLKYIPHISDDEPLYDSVASDEDYAALLPTPHPVNDENKENKSPKTGDRVSKNYEQSLPPERSSVSSPQRLNNSNEQKPKNSYREVDLLREQLLMKDAIITDLQSKLEILKSTVENLKCENDLLKKSVHESRHSVLSSNSPPTRDLSDLSSINTDRDLQSESNEVFENKVLSKVNQRPMSMYETRERSKYNWQMTKHQFTSTDNELCENTCDLIAMMNNVPVILPNAIEVHKHTEIVTKGIQELWSAMQDPASQGLSFCLKGTKIKLAVDDLLSIFPKKTNDQVANVLLQLSLSCKNLETVCNSWKSDETVDRNAKMDSTRGAAYELAKAAKTLVSNFPLNTE